jgi:hypothetical protein
MSEFYTDDEFDEVMRLHIADGLTVHDACRTVRERRELDPVGKLTWKWHNPSFASLLFGRVELAQIHCGVASRQWFWTLRFTEGDEVPSHSAPILEDAQQVCIDHARKVLSS